MKNLADLETKINNLITFKIKMKNPNNKITEGLLLKEIPIKDHLKNKSYVKMIKILMNVIFFNSASKSNNHFN